MIETEALKFKPITRIRRRTLLRLKRRWNERHLTRAERAELRKIEATIQRQIEHAMLYGDFYRGSLRG